MKTFELIILLATVGSLILAWKQYQAVTDAKKKIDGVIKDFKGSTVGGLFS